ncbi:AGAP011197-PA-like protein [Anopheles sinensis]|uniref:AGAP011197-PA-like protein n=1 Tax=Anopheles sinensis TaxID=74873 RepID=A0A084W3L7_ANOSI|nr:AGAP011197-PA-like protein [Anopheles sinensis]
MFLDVRMVICCCSLVFMQKVSSSVESVSMLNSTEQTVSGYGHEVILSKLDYLQYKLHAMEFGLKERDEQLAEKLTKLEDTIETLQWAITRHDRDAGHNLTALQVHSRKILAQQTACASHTQMRTEIDQLASKAAQSKNTEVPGWELRKPSYRSCMEAPAKQSGVYSIQLGNSKEAFDAFCEQNSFDGGWLVIQNRFDGSLDFFRNWTEYRNGFGSVYQEFWIGLERLHKLTSDGSYELIVEIKDFDGKYRYAHYKEFQIGSETEQYSLKKLGAYDGTAGDSLAGHKGYKFTTKDNDNDSSSSTNCAISYEGAWWYTSCHSSNLNGRYLQKLRKTISINHYTATASNDTVGPYLEEFLNATEPVIAQYDKVPPKPNDEQVLQDRTPRKESYRSCKELMVEFEDFDKNYRFSHYKDFEIGIEYHQFELNKLGTYDETAGDSMAFQKGVKFSTIDRKNNKSPVSCALKHQGAWWNRLFGFELEWQVYEQQRCKIDVLVFLKNNYQSLAYSRMMIREIEAFRPSERAARVV